MALVVAALGVLPFLPAAAQERTAFRGPALELYAVRSPAWRAERQDPARNTHDIPATGGLGLSFAWAVTPNVAPFVAAEIALYGESGVSTVAAGVEGRLPLEAPVVPRATIGIGHAEWSGGLGYDYLQLGAGADLFVLSRLAVRGEVEQQIRFRDEAADITGGGPRVSIGAAWYMGSIR